MASIEQPTPRPVWTRLYHRFIDWLWHGPLTRDLYPYVPPERQYDDWQEEQWRRW